MDRKTPPADTLRAVIDGLDRAIYGAFLHGTGERCTTSAHRGESPFLSVDRLREAMKGIPPPSTLAGIPLIVSEYVPTTEIVDHLTRDGRSLLRRIFSGQLFGLGVRSVEEPCDNVYMLATDGHEGVALASPSSAAVMKSYQQGVSP